MLLVLLQLVLLLLLVLPLRVLLLLMLLLLMQHNERSSSYEYPRTCVAGARVEMLRCTGGTPPVQVRWPRVGSETAHEYFCEFEDLFVGHRGGGVGGSSEPEPLDDEQMVELVEQSVQKLQAAIDAVSAERSLVLLRERSDKSMILQDAAQCGHDDVEEEDALSRMLRQRESLADGLRVLRPLPAGFGDEDEDDGEGGEAIQRTVSQMGMSREQVRNTHLMRSAVDPTLPSPLPCYDPLTR